MLRANWQRPIESPLCIEDNIPIVRPFVKGRLTDSVLDLPCQRIRPWSYNNCFGYYDGATHTSCQFIDVVDVEDIM